MEQAVISQWFARLSQLLTNRKLPCENSPARVCSADEFMLMQVIDGVGQFKHSDTRNYVFVLPSKEPNKAYELYVPVTTAPFNLGFFDKF